MYDFIPPHQNRYAHLWALGLLFLVGITCTASAFVPNPYQTILQAVAMALLIPMIQLVTRYMVNRYLYRIATYEDGNADLEIYSYRGGSKMQLVCRVGLEEITAAKPLSEENRKPPSSLRRYNYMPDIHPKNALVLSVTNGDGDCEIILCPDEKMTALLTPGA